MNHQENVKYISVVNSRFMTDYINTIGIMQFILIFVNYGVLMSFCSFNDGYIDVRRYLLVFCFSVNRKYRNICLFLLEVKTNI